MIMTLKRINWIDNAKAIGIIVVVYGHVGRGLEKAGITYSYFKEIDNFIYSFHMPLFFVLSGLFFVKSIEKQQTKEFVISKISSILYPYLIWSLIQIVIQFAASSLINGDVTKYDVLTFFLPRGQFWFLLALFIIIILNLITFINYKYNGLIITSLSAILICHFIKPDDFTFKVFYHLIFFNIGCYLTYYKSLIEKISLKSTTLLIALIWLSTYLLSQYFNLLIFDFWNSLTGSLSIISLSLSMLEKENFITYIGKYSIIIYLMHIIVTAFTRIILKKIFHIEEALLHILIGTLFGVIIPCILYKYLLKNKFYYLFNQPFTTK